MVNSRSLAFGAKHPPSGARVGLNQVIEMVIEQAPSIIEQVIVSMGGKGDKPAKGIGMITPSFPAPMQSAVNAMIANKQQVVDTFAERLLHYLYLGVGYSVQPAQLMRFDDLKQFEEEELDENIQVAGALQEITMATDEVMPSLDALISSLLGWMSVQSQINPLRPEVFARALRDCISVHVSDEAMCSAIVPHAATRLGVLLRKLYAEVCQWLRASGVEEVSPAHVLQRPGVGKAPLSSANRAVEQSLLTLGKLRRLLLGELDSEAAPVNDFVNTMPESVMALQEMQQVEAMIERLEKKAKDAIGQAQGDARLRLAKIRGAISDSRELGKLLGEEVTRLMLDNLVQDHRLLAGVRALLQTLEPLLVEIAHSDSRFFGNTQHPARLYLAAVTHRSLAFSSERQEGYAHFIKSLTQSTALLKQLTQAGESPQKAFSQVLKRLNALWSRMDAQIDLQLKDAARALQHAEQRNAIATTVAQEFRQQAQGSEVPAIVLDFACGPWAHVIAQSQLRAQNELTDPQGYQALVSDLFWSVQPAKAKRNRRRLAQLIPALISRLREGLQDIEFAPDRATDFFNTLMQMHELALSAGKGAVAAKPKKVPAANDARMDDVDVSEVTFSQFDAAQFEESALQAAKDAGDVPTVFDESDEHPAFASSSFFDEFPSSRLNAGQAPSDLWLAQSEAADSGFLTEPLPAPNKSERAASGAPAVPGFADAMLAIPVGSWIEIMLDQVWVRAQLTWVSPMRTLFMFVSHAGKAHSMTKRMMDQLATQGQIRLVSDGRMVDSALDAVAQTALRNSARRDSEI